MFNKITNIVSNVIPIDIFVSIDRFFGIDDSI